jgi:hypothetical protein
MPVTISRYSRPAIFLRRAVRRGASWTAAYHLQLTVAAVARPVRSSVVPSSSVLLSGPDWGPPRRRLPSGAASGHPAVRRCRRGRHCQDVAVASVTSVRHAVSTQSVPRLGSAVQPAGVRPVRCPVTRGSSSGGRLSSRLLAARPVSSPLLSIRPASGRLVSALHPSGRVCLLPPPAVALGTRSRRPGNPHHHNGSRSPWAAAEVARWSVGVSVADPDRVAWAAAAAHAR